MRGNSLRLWLATVLVLLSVLGCGPGGPQPEESLSTPTPAKGMALTPTPAEERLPTSTTAGETTPAAGGEITTEQRTKALNDLAAFCDSLPGEHPEADRGTLASYMKSRPDLEDAGVAEDGSVWGRFADGRLVILVNPTEVAEASERTGGWSVGAQQVGSMPSDPGARDLEPAGRQVGHLAGVPAPARTLDLSAASGPGGELPESSTAVVASALPIKVYGAEEVEIRQYLEEKKYAVQATEATVDNLKGVRGVGVFYLNTHGGLGQGRWPGSAAGQTEWIFALYTATEYTAANEERYREDLDSGNLVYMWAGDGWRYAITINFIRRYVSFSKDSFVHIAACGAFTNDMRFGFMDAGASVYSSWTRPVLVSCAVPPAKTLFDLLLGINHYVTEQPPHRPFDYQNVWEYLRSKGLDKCPPYGDTTLMFDRLHGDFAILAPSIRNMEVDEEEETLTLHGTFGTSQGEVTINAGSVKVTEWEAERIVVELPGAKQSNGAGDVVVTVRAHESNAVPLTRWHGKLSYTVKPTEAWAPGPQQTAEFDLYFRADVHPYREKPGQKPIHPGEIPYKVSKDSSGEWTCDGSGVFDAGPPIGEIPVTYSGSGDMPVDHVEREEGWAPFQSTFFNFYGQIDATARTLAMVFTGGTTFKEGCIEKTGDNTAEHALYVLDCLLEMPDFVMDRSFNIAADGIECGAMYGRDVGYPAFLDWSEIKAEHIPDDQTQAMVPGWGAFDRMCHLAWDAAHVRRQ